jgi:hypothetical protein
MNLKGVKSAKVRKGRAFLRKITCVFLRPSRLCGERYLPPATRNQKQAFFVFLLSLHLRENLF